MGSFNSPKCYKETADPIANNVYSGKPFSERSPEPDSEAKSIEFRVSCTSDVGLKF